MTLNLLDAAGRVLLLSGAWGGVGRAVMARWLAAGGTVVALDRASSPALDGVTVLTCDVTDEAAVETAVIQALEAHGRIDAFVHAAGIVGGGPLEDMALSDWRAVMDANLTSAFLLTRALHAPLHASKGAVVLLGSTNGANGGSALSGAAYAAAKAGVANLGRHLAKAWSPQVRVNVVAPGPVCTPMLDRLSPEALRDLKASLLTGELIEADEVAAAVAFLLSDHARSITGTTLNLSGGLILD
ncbi:SDR family NAD(P)-dependent oxidoreductase [Brevundimonas faecalis]|uniref:3-oxoacyl-[acyl-carrier protein] reductase n=1 Tax=Brevundimonas faecalis TaxID=947378 RepID=A0ABV2RBB1_9CAUL